jgi:putative Holliday junction resolvase
MIINHADALKYKTNTVKILGVDFGEKNIGLSICDFTWTIASPLQLLKRTTNKVDIASLLKIAEDNNVAILAFGYPLNMNGTKGPSCERIERFIEKIQEIKDFPIVCWDERLSTTAITRVLLEADLSRSKRKDVVDRAAASYILQGYLDYLKLL